MGATRLVGQKHTIPSALEPRPFRAKRLAAYPGLKPWVSPLCPLRVRTNHQSPITNHLSLLTHIRQSPVGTMPAFSTMRRQFQWVGCKTPLGRRILVLERGQRCDPPNQWSAGLRLHKRIHRRYRVCASGYLALRTRQPTHSTWQSV